MDARHVLKLFWRAAQDKSPYILQATGTIGFITTVIMAVKATPEAQARLDEIDRTGDRKKDVIAVAKHVGPVYLPAVGTGVLSLASFYGASHIQAKRNAVLATAATLSEKALVDYQKKVVERLGKKKDGDILESVAEDTEVDFEKAKKLGPALEGEGDTLCYDRVTDRLFWSSLDRIRQAESTVVKRCVDDFTVPLNEFYAELGLRSHGVVGEAIGWDIAKVKPDIHFSSKLEDGAPTLVIYYHTCMLNRRVLESVY